VQTRIAGIRDPGLTSPAERYPILCSLTACAEREDRIAMSIKGKAYVVGIYEHPTRKAEDKSVAQLHAESAKGALDDAGLTRADIDGYFCAGDAPGLGPLSMTD
jgi:hypothetical protein